MAKDPPARYGSMRELGDALGEYLRAEAPASEPTPAPAAPYATASAPPPALQEVIEDAVADPPTSVLARVEPAAPAGVQSARRRLWPWLVGVGLLGSLLLGGLVYFSQTPTVQVAIDITDLGREVNDRSLAFFLDEHPIPVEELKAPMELEIDAHELLVKRGDEIVRQFTFVVRKDTGPWVALEEVPRQLPVKTAPVVKKPECPLDYLDPAAIPAVERRPWHSPELVAVLGSNKMRFVAL